MPPARTSTVQARRFCIVVNFKHHDDCAINFPVGSPLHKDVCDCKRPEEEQEKFKTTVIQMHSAGDLRYVIAALECVGCEHIQAYIELNSQWRFMRVKTKFPRAHIEPANGTSKQNILYCKKGAQSKVEWEADHETGINYGRDYKELIVLGTPSANTQGKDPSRRQVIDMVRNGATNAEICDAYPEFLWNNTRNLLNFRAMFEKPRDPERGPKEVQVFFGPTGTGKSANAFKENMPMVCMLDANNYPWFDGCQHAPGWTLIIEEFRAQIPFGVLLRICDRYPMTLQVKTSTIQNLFDKIVITCPAHPVDWYKNLNDNDGALAQLKRRITKISYFTQFGAPPRDVTDLDWNLREWEQTSASTSRGNSSAADAFLSGRNLSFNQFED